MSKRILAAILVAFAAVLPLTAWGEAGKAYPTNLEMVQQAAKAAGERIAREVPSSEHAVVLRVDSPRPLDWVVEEALISALIQAGIQVYKATSGDSLASLIYRTVDLGVSYQDRPGGVERVARARIAFSLAQGNAGRVLASGDGQGTVQDLVPASLMAGLETPEIVPVKLPAKESLSSRLVEPALLSAVVAGLIYLFYSSKAAK